MNTPIQILTTVLFLTGPLVAVPLGLKLASDGNVSGRWLLARRLWLPCALALLVSFFLGPGLPAGLLALPWVAFTLFVGFLGVLRMIRA